MIVFVGGILTNVTPCVYPMIPITIRLLSSQQLIPVVSFMLYGLGIIITYTSLGMFAALYGSMFGKFMANSYVNVVLAVIMLLLGVSFLGFWDFGSIIQKFGYKISSSKFKTLNIFLMGIGAGFVASPCTGPILASLLAYTAQKQNIILGTQLLFVYSVGFALPYIILGILVSKVSRINISYNIQLLIKILFTSVMFALCLYYLKIPFYSLIKHMQLFWGLIFYLSFIIDVVLVILWLKISLLHNKLYMLIPTWVLGVCIFAFTQWMTTMAASPDGEETIRWIYSQQQAFTFAKDTNKPIFIDNWAEWCAACKKLDFTTFKDKELIVEINQNWIAFKKDLTEETITNELYQEIYDIQGLPTIILMSPDADMSTKKNIIGVIQAKELLQHMQDFKNALVKDIQ